MMRVRLLSLVVALLALPAVPAAAVSLGGWTPGEGWRLEVTAGGVRLTALAPTAGPIARFTAADPPARWLASARFTGTGAVQLGVGDTRSAPARLDGVAQRVGLTGTSSSAALTVDLLPAGTPRPGDSVTVEGMAVTAAAPSTTSVSPTGQVLLNGNPYVMKGFTYLTMPIGDQFIVSPWADPPACQNDARLMAGAGVNTLRIVYQYDGPVLPDTYRQCIDAFYANGIGVNWLIFPTMGGNAPIINDPNWAQVQQAWLQMAIDHVAAHPASYMWTIANETEFNREDEIAFLGDKRTGQVGQLERLVTYVEAHDPNHITSYAGFAYWNLQYWNVPSVDAWAFNVFSPLFTSAGASGVFSALAADPRPKYFSEFGTDRYRCVPGLATVTVQQETGPYTIPVGCSTTNLASNEDQAAQATALSIAWSHISSRISTDKIFGGTAFMYSDNWSYSIGALEPANPANHETIGRPGPGYNDGFENAEWWGITAALPRGATILRPTSVGFDTLAAAWRGTGMPTVSGFAITPFRQANGLCGVTASWTSASAASTELLYGLSGSVGNDGGDEVMQSTIYDDAFNDIASPTYTTSHSVTLALDIISGAHMKFQPRGFTSTGTSGTGEPWMGHVYC